MSCLGTSGGMEEDIDKKVGGKCQSDNMKLAIYVCKREENCSVNGKIESSEA